MGCRLEGKKGIGPWARFKEEKELKLGERKETCHAYRSGCARNPMPGVGRRKGAMESAAKGVGDPLRPGGSQASTSGKGEERRPGEMIGSVGG